MSLLSWKSSRPNWKLLASTSTCLKRLYVFSPCGLPDDIEAQIPSSITRCPAGMKVLGAPIGSTSFCSDFTEERMRKTTTTVYQYLPSLQDPQIANKLLAACLVPRTDYLLRLVSPLLSRGGAKHTDRFNARSFSTPSTR